MDAFDDLMDIETKLYQFLDPISNGVNNDLLFNGPSETDFGTGVFSTNNQQSTSMETENQSSTSRKYNGSSSTNESQGTPRTPWYCTICQRSFAAQFALDQHRRFKHQGYKIHCRFCTHTTSNGYAMFLHTRREHGDEAAAAEDVSVPSSTTSQYPPRSQNRKAVNAREKRRAEKARQAILAATTMRSSATPATGSGVVGNGCAIRRNCHSTTGQRLTTTASHLPSGTILPRCEDQHTRQASAFDIERQTSANGSVAVDQQSSGDTPYNRRKRNAAAIRIGTVASLDCDLCDKKFAFHSGLRMHMKMVHSGFKFTCQYCGMNFTNGYAIHRHVNIVHNVSGSPRKTGAGMLTGPDGEVTPVSARNGGQKRLKAEHNSTTDLTSLASAFFEHIAKQQQQHSSQQPLATPSLNSLLAQSFNDFKSPSTANGGLTDSQHLRNFNSLLQYASRLASDHHQKMQQGRHDSQSALIKNDVKFSMKNLTSTFIDAVSASSSFSAVTGKPKVDQLLVDAVKRRHDGDGKLARVVMANGVCSTTVETSRSRRKTTPFKKFTTTMTATTLDDEDRHDVVLKIDETQTATMEGNDGRVCNNESLMNGGNVVSTSADNLCRFRNRISQSPQPNLSCLSFSSVKTNAADSSSTHNSNAIDNRVTACSPLNTTSNDCQCDHQSKVEPSLCRDVSTQWGLWCCPFCPLTYQTLQQLRQHAESHFVDIKPTSSETTTATSAVTTMATSIVDAAKRQFFPCTYCGRRFSDVNVLASHEARHL